MQAEGKTALVLSAGGMYGAYQAGVWEAIAGVFEPDIVVGASIGSLNGWMIAGGLPADYLLERWLDLERASRLRWRLPRSLAAGCLQSDHMLEWIRELHTRIRPVRQFGLVSTRLPRLEQRLFQNGEVTWEHLAASCAIPLVLPQRKLDAHWYSDGGLLDPLPVWAARRMGARRIVAVNVMADRPGPVRWMSSAACRLAGFRPTAGVNAGWITISPAARLGPLIDSIRWSRENASQWIEAGRRDGLRHRELIVECLKQP